LVEICKLQKYANFTPNNAENEQI
jgi:hypothetical protein